VLSTRYAPAICLVLILALIPTIIHSYAGVVTSDRLSTKTIPVQLGAYTSVPTKRSEDWGERHFDSHDWIERQYVTANDTVVLTAVRSYDLKELYHHPELAVAYHFASFSDSRIATFPERPDIPVHVLSGGDSGAAGLYVLHYDGRFISDPILFQLRTAGELLFSGRKPMTLLFVRDDSPTSNDPMKLPAAQLLLQAIQAFTRGSGA
jgi:hypothetical protein